MNECVKNLNRIEFVVTMACTGKCKHCSQGNHDASSEQFDADIAEKIISDICSMYTIESLMTFGGEPLLWTEVVSRIHKAAAEQGIPKRQLITNGFFSKDRKRIKEVVDMLADSELGEIALSVDAFHQETIPLEPVKYFAECVTKTDMSIKLHPAWLVDETDNNPYNVRTREIMKEFDYLKISVSSGNVIFPSGNAVKYLGEYFDENKEYTSPYDEDPKDIRAIGFLPDGDVLDGNVYRDSIIDILNGYRA